MFRPLITSLALVLLTGAMLNSSMPPPMAASVHAAEPVPQNSSGEEALAPDADAERRLLELANQAREQAGLGPLQADDVLTKAARTHASTMAVQQQLSHQFSGEPSLPQRLASASSLHLDVAGENVAYSSSVENAEQNLLNSPSHRANLLSSAYNVAGFGIIRSKSLIYVVQDFGHELPVHSADEAADLVASGVNRLRSEMKLEALPRADGIPAQKTACAMAKADSLNTSAPQGRYILRYTSMRPETLPSSAAKAVEDRTLHSFSAGTCFAHTNRYPNGVYWVTLLFY